MAVTQKVLGPQPTGHEMSLEDNQSSKDCTWFVVLDALWKTRLRAGQRPQRADVLQVTRVNFQTSLGDIFQSSDDLSTKELI